MLPHSATGVEFQRSGMRKHFVLQLLQVSRCRTAFFDPVCGELVEPAAQPAASLIRRFRPGDGGGGACDILHCQPRLLKNCSPGKGSGILGLEGEVL